MPWKDNVLGMTIERTMDVDFAALKAAGVGFVTIEAGTGWDFNPAFGVQLKAAQEAGLAVLLQYVPIPALDDYPFEAPAREQIVALEKAIAGKNFNGLLISMERYWVGYDIEQGRNPPRIATKSAVERAAHELVHSFTKLLGPRNIPVLIRSNDKFVMTYGPGITGWSDAFGFYLADWRYRTRDAEGNWNVYTFFPAQTISAIADVVTRLPGDNTKNPLVPGLAPQLKFWEFTGSVTMPTDLVRGWDGKALRAKFALFNGPESAMLSYLKTYAPGAPADPDPTDPTPPSNENPSVPMGDLSGIETALGRIITICEGIAVDVQAIRGIFRS